MALSRGLLIGGAGALAVGLRLARSIHLRWRGQQRPRQLQLPAPAEPDYAAAAAALRAASRARAPRSAETTEPEVGANDVDALRGELRRELERLAANDVKESRTGITSPPQG